MRGKYQDEGAKLTELALSIKVNDNGEKANLLTANCTHTVVPALTPNVTIKRCEQKLGGNKLKAVVAAQLELASLHCTGLFHRSCICSELFRNVLILYFFT